MRTGGLGRDCGRPEACPDFYGKDRGKRGARRTEAGGLVGGHCVRQMAFSDMTGDHFLTKPRRVKSWGNRLGTTFRLPVFLSGCLV